MKLVPGICTQCGAVLSVDNGQKCICPYCHLPFISEEAVAQFNNAYCIKTQNAHIQQAAPGDFNIVSGVLYKYIGESTDIVVPPDVYEIKTGSFPLNVTSVKLPAGLTEIEDGLFQNCTELKRVDISNHVTTIGERAFANCINLTSITIPEAVTAIGERAFFNCSGISNITIPKNVISIGAQAFSNCKNLTGMTLEMLPF